MTRPWRLQRIAFFALIIVASMLLLAACGDDDDDDDDPAATSGSGQTEASTTEGDMDLSGSIDIDGSSTVFPISEGVAEEFSREYPDVNITVGFSGSGAGFEKFCAGETQISDASRPIKDEEVEACASEGIEFTEFRVAIDGLSVVVNPRT
ncbi:MAG: substrate-binding domain-containing protein [Thermomicrobiales bacterium]